MPLHEHGRCNDYRVTPKCPTPLLAGVFLKNKSDKTKFIGQYAESLLFHLSHKLVSDSQRTLIVCFAAFQVQMMMRASERNVLFYLSVFSHFVVV